MAPVTIVIEAGINERHYWRDLWRYRELFLVLAWRDVSVRYKQSIFGFSWAIVRPLLTMVAFTIVFGKIAQLPSVGEAPYALMVFAGLLPWQLFAGALADSSNSLVGNVNLITKVYFPRFILPIASVVASFADFLVGLVFLLGLMWWYQVLPGWQILMLPMFVLMGFLACIGPGLWVASLNVKYRDFRQLTPFVVQIGLYISPVGFSSTLIPEGWRLVYCLNPMVSVIDGFRWAVLGAVSPLYLPGMLVGMAVILAFLALGVRQFRKAEGSFADLI